MVSRISVLASGAGRMRAKSVTVELLLSASACAMPPRADKSISALHQTPQLSLHAQVYERLKLNELLVDARMSA